MTNETCTSVECTTPGLYDFETSRALYLLFDHDGSEDVAITTELDEPILL